MAEFLRIEYTGKEKDTGTVFDTTDEKVAKEAGTYKEDGVYGSAPVVLGKKMLLKGLEDVLKNMKEGEEKSVELPPDKAFGERSAELVKLVPLKTFQNSKVQPYPGMVITLENGLTAKVQSVSGGRVRLDFNHELAGKTVEYKVKVVSKITKEDDKIGAVFEMTFPRIDVKELKVEKKEKEVEIKLPKKCLELPDVQRRKLDFTRALKEYVGLGKIKILEEY